MKTAWKHRPRLFQQSSNEIIRQNEQSTSIDRQRKPEDCGIQVTFMKRHKMNHLEIIEFNLADNLESNDNN